ncbi:MAG TPA: hemerythrin domain-containing protein [Bdellovibrionota bacterium]|nr:hemerythrin domain-containing protein [Bdellovibrionota bacterium]
MDALQLLRTDHEKIRALFNDIRHADSKELKREIFDRIKDDLDLHAHIEETVFYPAFADRDEFEEIIDESYDEHQEMTDLLEEIDETDIDDETLFDDDIEELAENFEYHVSKEEAEFFPIVGRALTKSQLEDLGRLLDEARQKLAAA